MGLFFTNRDAEVSLDQIVFFCVEEFTRSCLLVTFFGRKGDWFIDGPAWLEQFLLLRWS